MKKIISLLVIISCLLPCVTIAQAEESLVASITLDSASPRGTSMSASIGDVTTTPIVNNSYGKSAWKIGKEKIIDGTTDWTTVNHYIKLNVDESNFETTGRDNYRLDVTYYDYEILGGDNGDGNPVTRERGKFFVSYYNPKNAQTDVIAAESKGTGTWKKASVELLGADLGRQLSAGCDILISTSPSSEWEYSATSMYIADVKLYKLGTDANAELTFQTAGKDLNFTVDKPQQISYRINGAHDYSTRLNVTQSYSVIDEYGNKIWEGVGETVKLSKTGFKDCTIDLDVKKYGVHTLVVETTDDYGGYTKDTLDFAVLKNYSGELNDKFGISSHFCWDTTDVDTLPLYAKMGSGIIRDEIKWKDYEKAKGVYKIVDRDLNWLNVMNEEGIEPLILLGGENALYGVGEHDIPTGDALTAFGEYVYNVVKDLKGKVTYFEILNETNIWATDSDPIKQRGANYAAALKLAYERAKDANPNCKIVAFASAGWSQSYGDAILSVLPDVVNYFDVMSFHQYAHACRAESFRNGEAIDYIVNKLKNTMANGTNKPIWITETGFMEYSYGQTEREAAMQNVRHYLLNDYEPMYEKMFHYTWYDHHATNRSWDSNLAVLNRDFSAKKAYIAYAAMNSFLAGATCEDRTIDSNDNYTYRYTVGDNTEIKVLFNEFDKENTVAVTPAYEYTKLYDMYGNQVEMTGNTITIDGAPCYYVSSTEPIVDEGGSMDYVGNKASIKGSIEGAKEGDQIMIYALNPGFDRSDILVTKNALAYFDQVTIGKNGSYQFSFPVGNAEGEFKVYVGYVGSNEVLGPTTIDISREVTGTVALYAGTTKITSLSQLASVTDTNLTVKGIVNNSHNAKLNAILYAAGYSGDNMIWVNMLTKTPSIVGDNEITFDVLKSDADKADIIKIFLWRDNNSPIIDDVIPIQ